MATIEVPANEFVLKSTFTCTTTYYYNSTGSLNSSKNAVSNLKSGKKTVSFPVALSSGKKIVSAKVHATHTTGLIGGTFTIDGKTPDAQNFVTLDNPDASSGSIDVEFEWESYKHTTASHSGENPSYNGNSSQSVVRNHESPSTIDKVYLLIETSGGGIYCAKNGELVPYKFYHTENGELVPYQITGG